MTQPDFSMKAASPLVAHDKLEMPFHYADQLGGMQIAPFVTKLIFTRVSRDGGSQMPVVEVALPTHALLQLAAAIEESVGRAVKTDTFRNQIKELTKGRLSASPVVPPKAAD